MIKKGSFKNEVFHWTSWLASLWGKTQEKTYMGSATISLDGTNVNIYCENKRMKKYSEILGKQAYSYYSNKIGI